MTILLESRMALKIIKNRLLLRCIHHFKSDLLNQQYGPAAIMSGIQAYKYVSIAETSVDDAVSGARMLISEVLVPSLLSRPSARCETVQ